MTTEDVDLAKANCGRAHLEAALASYHEAEGHIAAAIDVLDTRKLHPVRMRFFPWAEQFSSWRTFEPNIQFAIDDITRLMER